MEFRKYQKAVTTYGKAFLKHINPVTSRIHSSYWQIQDSSRFSSNDPNLQNIPSKLEGFRECFTNSNKTFRLVIADYSSQESRVLADLAKDLNMINFFNGDDDDFHSYTARNMWGVPVRNKVEDSEGNIIDPGENLLLRSRAKILNFGIA